MKKIKYEKVPAREAEYVDVNIYDSFDEWKVKGCPTSARVGFENWSKLEINGITCYVFRHELNCYSDYIDEYSEIVTEEVYKEILSRCDIIYKVYSNDVELFRKYYKYSGFCSGKTVDEVLEKLLNPSRSFLGDVNEEIDKRIESLEKEIQRLKEDKEKVNNKEFLESRLTKTYELRKENC